MPDAAQYLPSIDDAFSLVQDRVGRCELIRRIYDSLVGKRIRYSWEEFHPSEAIQLIRTPLDLVTPPHQGTCLDLVTFFCGVCLGYELLPIILMFDGHALAAVSLTHYRREWDDPTRPGFHRLRRGLRGQADLELFRDLVERGEYLPVECTGFARRPTLPADRPERGHRGAEVLDFDEAVRVGLEQLRTRTFQFGIDVAAVQYGDRIEPDAPASGLLSPEFYVANTNKSVIARTAAFVEREDLNIKHLHDFAARFKCGYFHIKGDSGVGKTALAASLARALGASVVFVDAGGNVTTPVQCWRRLAAGLIVRQGLPGMGLWELADQQWQKPVIDRFIDDAVALSNSESPTWLVIDGLDETRNPQGANPLYLPDRLPQGMYILLTSRSLYPWKPIQDDPETGYEEHTIQQGSPEQNRAIRAYLKNVASSRKGPDLLRASRTASRQQFVERLTSASLGNFKYLEFVIAHLLSENGSAYFESGGLPRGLDKYYGRFFKLSDGGSSSFPNLEQFRTDIVALLAAAGEPVTVGWLADHSGASATDIQNHVLRTWFGPLSFEDRGATRYYRVVHQSFADFLEKKRDVDFGALHRKIGAYYLDERNRAKHEGYAVRQLAAHLRKGADLQALVRLLFSQSWQAYSTSDAGDPTGSALVADVEEAWAAAAAINRHWLAVGAPGGVPLLAFEVYCALLKSTFLTRAQAVPPSLLVTQVTKGRWSIARAEALAALNPDTEARDRVLARLDRLPGAEPDAAGSADQELTATASAHNGGEGAMQGSQHASVSAAAANVGERFSAYLAELSVSLAATGHPRIALELARLIARPYDRADALARLVDGGLRPVADLLNEAWAAIRTLDDREARESTIETMSKRADVSTVPPPPHPGRLSRSTRRAHAIGCWVDQLLVSAVLNVLHRTFELQTRLVPWLRPPAELWALQLAVAAPPWIMRGMVSGHKLRERFRPLAWSVMPFGLLVVMLWSRPQLLLQLLPPVLLGLGAGVLLTGVAAVAVRHPTIKAWLQRRRVQTESLGPTARASLAPPSTETDLIATAEALVFTATWRIVKALTRGLATANILVPIALYLGLLARFIHELAR